MKFTLNFKELSKKDTDIAGGKGASLGEMTQAGIPVPPGYVVLSSTFDEFIKATDLIQEIDAALDKVKHEDINTVEVASEDIQALIKHAVMPKSIADEIKKEFKELDAEFVAVRSSATAEDGAENAWAGQLDSYLNTKEENLLEKVQHCWASLFTPRAIFYRFEKGLHKTKISVAVVIQKMVNSEVSGIAFSVHPVTEDRNQMIIEAGFGLGEAIVSGQVTPDSYVVEKEPRKIIDINVSTQERALYRVQSGGNEWINIPEPKASSQVLTEKQIFEFGDIIMRIENHYGFPCDIEWAFEGGKFYIVQSRPITTLSKNSLEKVDIDPLANVGFWRLWGRWKTPLFTNVPYNSYAATEIFKKLNLPVEFKGWAINMAGYVYAYEEDHKVFNNFILDKFNNDLKWFDNFFKYSEQLEERANKLKRNKDIVECMEIFTDIGCLTMIIHFCDKGLENIVPEVAISSGLSSEEFTKVLIPFKATYTMQFKEALFQLKENKIDMKSFLNEFDWIGSGHLEGKRLTESDVNNELLNLNKEDDLPTVNLKHLDTKILSQITVLQKLIYFRSLNAELVSKIINSQWEALDILAEKNNTLRHNFGVLTPTEIIFLVKKGLLPDDFQNRLNQKGLENNGISYVNGKLKLYFGNELDNLLIVFEQRTENNQTSVSGTIAFKGKVRGAVRIVENIQDLQKINEGDVIVSPETMPDYIIGMKKAAAFVTNQGGITSHAAIVARELKKPCIIGTKVATKIFKDGDFVEVDADNGVVRIIKKNDTKIEYFKLGRWVAPVLEYEAWLDWCDTEESRKIGLTSDKINAISIDGNFMIPNNSLYAALTGTISDEFNNNKFNTAKEIISIADDLSDKCIKLSHSLGVTASFDQLVDSFELIKRLRFPWMACFAVSDAADSYLKSYSEKSGISVDVLVSQIPQLTNSLTDDQKVLFKFKKELNDNKLDFNIVEIRKSHKDLAERIEAYQKETEFIGTHHFWGEPRTIEKLLEAIKNLHLEDLKVAESPKDLKELFDIIALTTKFRLECAQSSGRLAYSFRLALSHLAEKFNIKYEDIVFLTIEEIKSLNKESVDDVIQIIKERQKGFGIYKEDGVIKITTGSDLEKQLKEHNLNESHDNVSEIKGNIGCKGVVTGMVAIVLIPKDNDKVKPGMILVASETTPDLIPAMSRAAGFITDSGGVTSHAAIVAREMKKPCIIGTKIATQVLKDGDMVEVDADNGIVRIIK